MGGQLPKEANMLAPVPPPILASHLQPDEDTNQQHQQHQSQQYEPEKKKLRLDQQQLQQDRKGYVPFYKVGHWL
jgi:hypothetical protein